MEGTQIQEKPKTPETVSDKNAEVLEGWLRAEKAPEPGTVKFDELIKDKELPDGVGMRYHSLQSAGWVYVYHTKTGDRSVVNRNMLRQQLQKKLPDGSYAFSLMPPRDKDGNIIKPLQGTIKCMLHKDSPDRALYDQMGFAVCPKDNIPNQHNLVQHMKHRHHVEWEAIEKVRIDAEKAEDRKFQQALYSKITDSIQPVAVPNPIPQQVVESHAGYDAPLYISDKPSKPQNKGGRPRKTKDK